MKNFLKYGAIGALGIGLFFGKYLGRWVVDVFDNSDTRINNGAPYVQQYMNNCDTLHLMMKNFTKKLTHFKVKGAFDLSKDDNTADLHKWQSYFFDKKNNKYFCISYFFIMNSMRSQMYGSFIYGVNQNGTNIIATVNK
ncbi:hypothetical protein [Pedobacter mendelii]|uniref:DUF8188 domain-containing protein n=1 Tax=Pedobacter mendelii TaxID=1908240 RepID=A0ABQ2BPF5_9SPHI|nr:hypothetical protein [Pedobacter mendelii]GGI29509.1 hypothetical protein GCM10008119_37980 [Pedobacter mendelii]